MNPYLKEIKSRLVAENAAGLSDKDLEKALKDCVCCHWLIPLAKKYRDKGLL